MDIAEQQLSGDEFFKQHGFYPTKVAPPRPVKAKPASSTAAHTAMQSARHLALRGWKAPLHWAVPPAFEYPGKVYEEIGHEAFCQLVREYYEGIKNYNCDRAARTHVKWAVRQILRTFETHVRGFRKQSVSKRGGLFNTASDELTLPETLIKDGRIIWDLTAYLRCYGVPAEQWDAINRLLRTKLTLKWGVRT